jgi:Putative phage tail protein
MTKLIGFGGGGGKGGGGGGSGGGASEDPNTLRSTQYATVLDALSEGPIYGLVNGAKSIFFDKVALQNEDGTYNFNNATFGYTTGDIASNQSAASAVTGDASSVESTTSVGVQVWQATPIIRTVTQSNVDHIRVTISTPALTNTDTSNGHVSGNTASFIISIQSDGGGFVEVISDSFSGKTTSKYSRDYLIPVSGSGPWDIKVSRTSNDDANTFSQSQTWFDEYTAIISTKLEYRHTAVAGISIDARQFSAIPTRAYDVKGIILNVPSNYDPITRSYSGTWDGTFKLAWSDNPAWIFYDLLTNPRYGLGAYIIPYWMDKWQLYTIAQYCDALVPDGFGGTEPMFTCNLYLKDRQDAYKAIQDLASVFRAITYWAGGAISVVQDAPQDPIQIFTPANVIDGAFNYQGASSKAMHTVCLVTYADPNNWYQANVEYVQSDEDVAKYGVIQTSITAIGCTSRGQAHRLGKWLLYSEKLESETISFRAGMDAIYCYPGAIIQTSDPVRAGNRMGGRVLGVSSNLLTLTIDAEHEYVSGMAPTITVMLENGVSYTGNIVSSSGNNVVLSQPLPSAITPNAMYLISQTNLEPEIWRVISVSETGDGNQIEISAVAHNPSKYGYIENGYNLTTPSISSIYTPPTIPSNLSVFSSWYVVTGVAVGIGLTVSWSGTGNLWNIQYSINNGQTINQLVSTASFDISNVSVGDQYTFTITAISASGVRSLSESIQYTVLEPSQSTAQLSALNARTVALNTTSQTFNYDDGGKNPSPATATITATCFGTTETPYYEFLLGGTTLQNSTSNTCTFTAPSNISLMPEQVTVNLREGSLNSQIQATDFITLIGLSPSKSSIVGALTNEAYIVSADSQGNVSSFASAGGLFEVWSGQTLVSASAIQFSVVSVKNLSITIDQTGSYAIQGMSSNSATATLQAVYNGVTITKVYSIAKSLAGAQGVAGVAGTPATVYSKATLYQWSTSQPANPNGESTYIWGTGVNTNYTGGNNWSINAPSNPGIAGIQLWTATIPVSAPAGTSSTTVSWSSGFTILVYSQNGLNGASGLQTAYPSIYQWALTIPNAPSGNAVYTWSSSSIDTIPQGWSISPGNSPSPGFTLWDASVNLVDKASNSTTAFNWSSAAIKSIGYAGTNGVNGAPGAAGVAGASGQQGASAITCYARIANNPNPITGNITTTSNNLPSPSQDASAWGLGASWSLIDPSPSSTNTLYQANGIYNPATNQTIWSTPFISSLKVGSLSAITTNTGNLNVTGQISSGSASIVNGSFAGSGLLVLPDGEFALGGQNGNLEFDGNNMSLNLVGASSLNIRTNTNNISGMVITSQAIKVFDESGQLRVQIGNLSV